MTTPTPIAAVADKVVDVGTGQNVPVLTMRMGKILSVNDQGTSIDVGLQLSGAVDENSGAVVELTGVKIIGAYVPVVGDTVWCLKNGADLPLVLGKVATSTPRGPHRFLQRDVNINVTSTAETNLITFNVNLDGGLYRVGMGWYGITRLNGTNEAILTFGLKTSGGSYWLRSRQVTSSGSVAEGGHYERVVDVSQAAYTLTYYAAAANTTNQGTVNGVDAPYYAFIEPYQGTLTWLTA